MTSTNIKCLNFRNTSFLTMRNVISARSIQPYDHTSWYDNEMCYEEYHSLLVVRLSIRLSVTEATRFRGTSISF